MAILAAKNLRTYEVPNPTKHYLDAVKTGRCIIVCVDIDGTTMACATIYGWSGGQKGNDEAARTNDLITICVDQFDQMRPGPKAICGDFNGPREAFPALEDMVGQHGWTDVGNHSTICQGEPGRATCHTNAKARETRIDMFFTNRYLTPAVKKCSVQKDADFPTHKPVLVEVESASVNKETRQLHKPTDFSQLFEEKVQREYKEAKEREEEQEGIEEQKHGETDRAEKSKRNKRSMRMIFETAT